jgi:hypothetical protein
MKLVVFGFPLLIFDNSLGRCNRNPIVAGSLARAEISVNYSEIAFKFVSCEVFVNFWNWAFSAFVPPSAKG